MLRLLIVLSFFLSAGDSPAAGKVTAVAYMSWFSVIGAQNGCNVWKSGEFGYRSSSVSNTRNYPLLSEETRRIKEVSPALVADSPDLTRILDKEFLDIKKTGFDVVAVDILPIPPNGFVHQTSFCGLNAIETFGVSASKSGLKTVLLSDRMNRSADYPDGRVISFEEWRSIYREALLIANRNDWYWKIDGSPVILQFGAAGGSIEGVSGSKSIKKWNELFHELAVSDAKAKYFVDIRPNVISSIQSINSVGVFMFTPGAPVELTALAARKLMDSGMDVFWTVSPGYYRQSQKVFFAPSFGRIHEGYISAINSNADKLLFITWNDYEENTDISPSKHKGDVLKWLVKFYNEWFKTGVYPSRPNGKLIVSVPMRSPEVVESTVPKWARRFDEEGDFGQAFYWINSPVHSSLLLDDAVVAQVKPGVNYGSVDLRGKLDGVFRVKDFGESLIFSIERSTIESQRHGSGGLEYRYMMTADGEI